MDFGTCLRNWRLEANLSQRELARRAGMDFTYLSKIEAGLVLPPSEEKIQALAAALGRSLGDIGMLLDLARDTKLPTEVINAALIRNPEVGALLRLIKDRSLSREQTQAMRRIVEQGNEQGPLQEDDHGPAGP